MAPKDSLDWLVEDSEDEDGDAGAQPARIPLPPPPPRQLQPQPSEISDFTARTAHLPLDKTSSISQFTNDNGHDPSKGKTIIAATASSGNASPVPVQDKPKPRPRPRPAFKGHLLSAESIDSPSSASRVASALNALNSGMSLAPAQDSPFPLDIAERAKMRRQANSSEPKSSGSKPFTSDVSGSLGKKAKETGTIVIDLSSDDDVRKPTPASSSMSGRTTLPNTSDPPQQSFTPFPIPPLPRRFDTSNLPPSDPPSSAAFTSFEHNVPKNASTPPSSPFAPRQPKRRKIAVDDESFDLTVDLMDVDKPSMPNAGVSDVGVAPKKKKERKPREKKGKTKALEVGAGMGGDASMPAPAPKKRKARESTKEAEFKSKEFIDTSDDDLDVIPSKPTLKPLPTPSVRGSAQLSVPPSAVVSDNRRSTGTESSSSSVSIPPSAAVSNPPSLPVSIPPSITIPSPMTAPYIEVTHVRDQLKKKKKSAKTLAGDDDDPRATGSSSRGDEIATAPKKRAKKDKKTKPDSSATPDKSVAKDVDLDDMLDSVVANVLRSKTAKKTKIVLSDEDDSGAERSILKPASMSDKPPKSKPISSTADKPKSSKDRRKRAFTSDDEEEEGEAVKASEKDHKSSIVPERQRTDEDKENNKMTLPSPKPLPESSVPPSAPKPLPRPRAKSFTPYSVPSREGSVSALIRRVSSKISSPLASPSPGYNNSPLAKSSRSALSRIAPLHPNRKEPPPPPPRPPAPKKSKKMLDLEEKWEEELAETVEGWSCMTDEERAALRRAKRDRELGFDD